MIETEARPLRGDAKRNRQRLMDAASAAFAERGLDVSMDEIAHRAGLGKGTIFRRFPTKECLVAAIAGQRLNELAQAGERLIDTLSPAAAMREFMERGVRLQSEDRGLFEAIGGMTLADPQVWVVHERLMSITGRLLARAQDGGAIRRDIAALDVFLLVCGISYAAGPLHTLDSQSWERYLDLVFDGLRPRAGQTKLRAAPSEENFKRALQDGCCAFRSRPLH